jgi:hypothetical protein
MTKKRFEVSDLVQIKSEYEEHDNPSLFRIREIAGGQARLGQLSSQYDAPTPGSTSTTLSLIAPHREILHRYARRYN